MIHAGLLEYVSLLTAELGNFSFHSWFGQNLTAVVLFGILILLLLFFVFRS